MSFLEVKVKEGETRKRKILKISNASEKWKARYHQKINLARIRN